MKKILVLLIALLASTSVLAQKTGKRITSSQLRVRLEQAQQKAYEQQLRQEEEAEVHKMVEEELAEEWKETVEIDENALNTIDSFVSFTNDIKTKTSQDTVAIFQALEPVKINFMALAAEDPDEAAHMAVTLNHPVALADGKTWLLANYLRTEMAKLPAEQQIKLKNFRETFLKSLNDSALVTVNNTLPEEYSEAIIAFRKAVANTSQENVSFIFQSMMKPMDEFYSQLKNFPRLGPTMAKEFVKPIKTSWGVVKPLDFINGHAVEVISQPMQDKLFLFARDIRQLSR